jgi:hypothetical protein
MRSALERDLSKACWSADSDRRLAPGVISHVRTLRFRIIPPTPSKSNFFFRFARDIEAL